MGFIYKQYQHEPQLWESGGLARKSKRMEDVWARTSKPRKTTWPKPTKKAAKQQDNQTSILKKEKTHQLSKKNKTLIHSWFLQYTIRELHNQNLSMRKIKSFSCKTWLKHKDKA